VTERLWGLFEKQCAVALTLGRIARRKDALNARVRVVVCNRGGVWINTQPQRPVHFYFSIDRIHPRAAREGKQSPHPAGQIGGEVWPRRRVCALATVITDHLGWVAWHERSLGVSALSRSFHKDCERGRKEAKVNPPQPPPAPSVCAAPSRVTSSCTNGRATPCLHSKGMVTTPPTGPCTTRALTATWMPYARLLHKEETRTLQTTFCGHLSIGERDAHAPTTVQHCFCGSLHHLMHTNFALVLTWRMCVWSRVAHTRSATYAMSQDCVGNECHDNLHRRHQGQAPMASSPPTCY